MYEKRHVRPLTPKEFAIRMAWHFAAVQLLVLVSLAVGMCGYHHYERLNWIDSFVNAAMILGGMGPVDTLRTDAGKIFAGLYALYAGLVLLIVAGVLFAPVIHRIAHKLHWADETGRGQ
ncbi:MAG: hypothetical protein ACHQXA_05095 [Gemmatimonadales bacterium]